MKLVLVEKVQDLAKDPSPSAKLEFAKFVLDRNYGEFECNSQQLSGRVDFDSVEGGMIAATFAALQQWEAGKLSDAAL